MAPIDNLPIPRLQTHKRDRQTFPKSEHLRPTEVPTWDPKPKRQEVSRECNNHSRDRSVQANLPANSRNSHPTIATFVAAVTYCPPTRAYPARRGQR